MKKTLCDEGDNIASVWQASLRSENNDLGLPFHYIHKLMNYHKHPKKFSKGQTIKPEDLNKKVEYCERVLFDMEKDANLLKNVSWTDQVKFSRESTFNRTNEHLSTYDKRNGN